MGEFIPCKQLSPKERYKLRIEQIAWNIRDLHRRFAKPLNEVLEDLSIELQVPTFIRVEGQTSIEQFEGRISYDD